MLLRNWYSKLQSAVCWNNFVGEWFQILRGMKVGWISWLFYSYVLIFVGFPARHEVLRQSFWWRMVCIYIKLHVFSAYFLAGFFLNIKKCTNFRVSVVLVLATSACHICTVHGEWKFICDESVINKLHHLQSETTGSHTFGLLSYFRCKIWHHILAWRPKFPIKVTKFVGQTDDTDVMIKTEVCEPNNDNDNKTYKAYARSWRAH